MVTEEVIKEIYKKYKKPPKDASELMLNQHLEVLKPFHSLSTDGFEVVLENLDDFNPFKRFLIRSIVAIIDLDDIIAFVFKDHIIFFGKNDTSMRVHFKPEEKSMISRLFKR
ncbi:MAG: hypothetical protein NC328_03645 [Muribaculum sp.]|nr:hypothetical protein [Muribaculum sp.]